MSEYSIWLTGTDLTVSEDLDREFEAQLFESSKLAFRVAYGVVRHRQDAEDIAQDALTKAYRNLRNLRNPCSLRAWLVRTTWRLAVDHTRSNKRRLNREGAPGESQIPDNAVDSITTRERSERLWKAIDALPEKLRLVIILAGIEEHAVREVASLLNLPEGTVKSRLFLARQRLKELLQ